MDSTLVLSLSVASAMGTIWMTHQTRGLISENGQLVLQHQALENEYRTFHFFMDWSESDQTPSNLKIWSRSA